MRRRSRSRPALALLLAGIAAAYFAGRPSAPSAGSPSTGTSARATAGAPSATASPYFRPDFPTAKVVRGVDGDTVVIRFDKDDREEKVRLDGVDTPESVDPRRPVERFGKEASAFTKSRLVGRAVRAEVEPANDRYRYGRLLAFLYVEDSPGVWTCFNETLVAEGYHLGLRVL